MYNLDEEESQGGIAINLLPLLAKDLQNKGEQQSQTKKAQKSVAPLPPLLTSPCNQWDSICVSLYFVSAGECHLSVCLRFSVSWGCVRRNCTRET